MISNVAPPPPSGKPSVLRGIWQSLHQMGYIPWLDALMLMLFALHFDGMRSVLVSAYGTVHTVPGQATVASEAQLLNLVLSGRNRIYWYRGHAPEELQLLGAEPEALRELIYRERRRIQQSGLFNLQLLPNPMIVLLKLTDDAPPRMHRWVIGELQISTQKRYMQTQANPTEIRLIQEYETRRALQSSLEKTLKNVHDRGDNPVLAWAASFGSDNPDGF